MVQLSHDSKRMEDSGVSLEEAFAACYQQSREDIYFYLLCFHLPQSQAQDLTQEVFVKLYQALQKEEQIENHRAWLFRVARNLALKLRARDGNFLVLDAEIERTLSASAADPEQRVMENERRIRILAALRTLSPQQRECLKLRATGLKYRDISSVIGISSSAVGEFLRRGLKKLREAARA
jgi:RNA polymerase sigma-70 factor (ECF subfamily)